MCDCDCECSERVARLEQELENLTSEVRGFREQALERKFDNLRTYVDDRVTERSDDAQRERAELRRDLEQLHDRWEASMGVDDESKSTPENRAQDLRRALIRRAESRTDLNQGKASMYYKEVQNMLADLGHGMIHREQCMRVMERAADADGFSMGEKTSKHGNTVKAVRVNTDDLPFQTRRNNVTTPESEGGVSDGIISGGDETQL